MTSEVNIKKKHGLINIKTFGMIIRIFAAMCLAILLFELVTNKDRAIFGYYFRIVITGSMEPTIKVNSLNVIKKVDIKDIKKGDIICFKSTSDIIHRVIEVVKLDTGEIILHTKGDANNKPDCVDINEEMLRGKVVYTFNGLATFIDSLFGIRYIDTNNL